MQWKKVEGGLGFEEGKKMGEKERSLLKIGCFRGGYDDDDIMMMMIKKNLGERGERKMGF